MTRNDVRLTEKQHYWLEHVEACAGSGQSMRQYAQAHELDVAAFYSWKATLRRKGVLESAEPAGSRLFRKAKVVDGRGMGCWRIVLPSGLALEFGGSAEPGWVACLVRALATR